MAGQSFELRGEPPAGSTARPAGRVALWLFVTCCLIYLGTARGVLDTVDDVAMLRVTESLVTRGTFAVAPDTPGAMPGTDGRWYTRYGVGQSLLAAPFYLAGSRIPSEPPRLAPYDPHGFVIASPVAFAVTLIGMLSTAASVAIVYLTSRELRIGHMPALAAALALGLGTFAWHYGRTFMSEPPSMLACALALYALVRYAQLRHVRWAVIGGVAAAALVVLRIGNGVFLPAFGLYLIFVSTRRREFSALVAWLAPIVACGALLALFNILRFGTPFETGYADQAQAFTTPLFVGLYGLTLSSGKGVFIYAPVVLAGVVGWFFLRRREPLAATMLVLLVVPYLVFYARFDWWYGGGPWGPRFVVVILPLLCLGVGALVNGRLSPGAWVAVGALAALSVSVQILSLVVPYLPYEAQMVQDELNYDRLIWNPNYSPIVAHARSVIRREYPIDLAFTYYPWPWLAWLQLAALTSGCVLLLAGGWSTLLPRRHLRARSAALPA